MLLVDTRNPSARAMHEAIAPHLDLAALPDDLHVIVGGDGWMLSCIHKHGPDPTYLGLNGGHLGFLHNDVKDPAAVCGKIMDGAWRAWSFPRLAMTAWGPDGSEVSGTAVNDIYVERMTGQTARIRLRIGGVMVVEQMVCDGLITATALGSTAYSFSAGGVPCHPLVPGIHVTPICPHAPRLSPFVLPLDEVVDVEILRHEHRPVRAVSDGIDHGPVVRMTVGTAPEPAKIAFLEGRHFTETMIRKVLKS